MDSHVITEPRFTLAVGRRSGQNRQSSPTINVLTSLSRLMKAGLDQSMSREDHFSVPDR